MKCAKANPHGTTDEDEIDGMKVKLGVVKREA